jgi:hypothetical protein
MSASRNGAPGVGPDLAAMAPGGGGVVAGGRAAAGGEQGWGRGKAGADEGRQGGGRGCADSHDLPLLCARTGGQLKSCTGGQG